MKYILQGWLLGIAYVAPIGMQNMFLINTAIDKPRTRALQVALVMIFFDVMLALACFFGIGIVLEHVAILRFIIMGVGSLAVIYIGYTLIKADPRMDRDMDYDMNLFKTIATCFVVTWLNPQAIIDGTLLLGGFKASLTSTQGSMFILGVAIASTSWFFLVAGLVSSFKSLLTAKRLKIINVICGSILVIFGLKLGFSFFTAL